MAFKTFTSGAVLTAADVNTYLAQQAVVVCTSTTRPSSPPEGMVVYETDTDALVTYQGAAWVRTSAVTTSAVETYTPTLTQSSSVAATVNEARYIRTGCVVEAWVSLTATAAGTAANKITVSLPVTSSGHTLGTIVGHAAYRSGSTWYALEAGLDTTSAVNFVNTPGTSTFGINAAVTVASSDVLRMHVRYTV